MSKKRNKGANSHREGGNNRASNGKNQQIICDYSVEAEHEGKLLSVKDSIARNMKERGVPVDFNYKLEGKKLFLYGLSPAYINGVTRSHPQNDINVRELVCSTVDIEPEIPDRKSVCDYVVISDRTSSLQALMAEVETHCRRGKNYQPNNFRLNNRTLKLNHIVGFDMEEAIGGYGGCVIAKSNCRYV